MKFSILFLMHTLHSQKFNMLPGENRQLFKYICILFTLLLLIIPASTQSKTQVVEAEGSGYNRDQAIHSALRSAVEKSIGIYISSQTKVENYQVISDKILSQTKGYVSQYKVISGSERTEFGLTFLRVKAEVKEKAIRDDLEAMKLIYSIKNLPRIMVFIKEFSPGMILQQRTSATVLENELLKKGFRLVDKEQMKKIMERDKARFSDNEEAAKIGFRLGADLLITGTAEAGEPAEETVYQVKQWRAPCQMNLRLIRTDNAQVISSVSLGNDWASKSKMQAMNSSLRQTAMRASERIVNDLISFWKDEVYNTLLVEVTVTGMDNRELNVFEERVRKIGVVRSVNLRYLEDNSSIFDVEIGGTIQDLRSAFSKMDDIAIHAMTYNRIDVSYGDASSGQKPEIKFEVAEPDVSIEKASFETIFPCIYSYYATHNAGNVLIKNNSSTSISNASLSVTVPNYSALPTSTKLSKIPPQKNAPFDFKLTLDTKAINTLNNQVYAQANVAIEYSFKGSIKKRQLNVPVTIESINALSWKDPYMAASFITPNNTVIKSLSRKAINALSIDRSEVIISELAHTAGIYNLLKSIGITYVKDPNSTHGYDVTDNINYPVQTLELKSGDCDDTSILLASMLESIGIETALIVYPDHVLVMFNTGIYEKNGMRISNNEKDYIKHNNKLWIPVETTQLQKSNFIQAWQSAVSEFAKAVNEEQKITIVDIHKAWKKYPVFDPFPQKSLPIKVNTAKIMEGFSKDIAYLRSKINEEFAAAEVSLKNRIKTDPSADNYNQLGILYARNGNIDKAEKAFAKACDINSSFSPAINNLGNIYCLKSNDDLSISTYGKAIKLKTNKGQYYINKGLCLFTQNKIEESLLAIRTGISRLGGAEEVEKILGIDIFDSGIPLKGEEKQTTPDQKKPEKEITKKRIKNLMRKVLEKVPDKEIKSYSKNILPVGGLRGADPEQIEKIADLLWWDG